MMARHEADREDLMKDATALVRRVELSVPDERELVVVGIRSTGFVSIYFGPDPVFHFDSAGRLRRAYLDGFLYRTQGDTLARLTRTNTETTSELLRYDLSTDECELFIAGIRNRLRAFHAILAENRMRVVRQVPDNDDALLGDLLNTIDTILNNDISLAPTIAGKR